jgi:hypothetical protein
MRRSLIAALVVIVLAGLTWLTWAQGTSGPGEQNKLSLVPPKGTPLPPVGMKALDVKPGPEPFTREDVSGYFRTHNLPRNRGSNAEGSFLAAAHQSATEGAVYWLGVAERSLRSIYPAGDTHVAELPLVVPLRIPVRGSRTRPSSGPRSCSKAGPRQAGGAPLKGDDRSAHHTLSGDDADMCLRAGIQDDLASCGRKTRRHRSGFGPSV